MIQQQFDTTAVFQRDVLTSFNHSLGHFVYYYSLGPYQGDPVIEELVCIAATGRGFSAVSGGAFWSCAVLPENIKQVHDDIMTCTTEDDLYDVKRKWDQRNSNYQGNPPGEALNAVPLIFEMRVPGSSVEQYDHPRSYTMNEHTVQVSTAYRVTYEGKIYNSHEYENWVPLGCNDLHTKQKLVIAGLQKILLEIAQQKDFWR